MQIGAHVSSAGGIDKAIDRAVAIGADSLQVFTQSPRAWRPTNHDPVSFERFREKRAEAGVGGVLCHAVYLTNLASPDPVTYERSVATLQNTAEVASAIGGDVVFHVGSHRDRHANILEGELGEKLGVFLSNPRFEGLPAVLETAGPDNRGPDAEEVRKTKDLRARWLT